MCVLRFNNKVKAEAFIQSKIEQNLENEHFTLLEKIVKLCSYGSNRLLDESYFVDLDVLNSCINIISKKNIKGYVA